MATRIAARNFGGIFANYNCHLAFVVELGRNRRNADRFAGTNQRRIRLEKYYRCLWDAEAGFFGMLAIIGADGVDHTSRVYRWTQ